MRLQEIDRLDKAVGSALLAARVARRNLDPVNLLIPLTAAVEAAQKSSSRPISIAIDLPSDGPFQVPGDSSALEQIFLNLSLNAVEAIRDAGEIRVAVERDNDQVTVRIVDTGTGLAQEAAGQAFEPFFTTRRGGTGLGLTIAARLARAHNGSVELHGNPVRGATATVRLPLI